MSIPIIQNVVSTLTLDRGELLGCTDRKLDLRLVANRLPNTVYRPERFSALSIRVREPVRSVALLFSTGRLVCVGTKSVADSQRAIAHFKRMITAAVIGQRVITNDDADDPSFKVQNIVASGTLGQPLNLPEIYEQLRTQLRPWLKSMSFNQELFPGMCIRMRGEQNAVCLLFASGKCVITGAHQEEEIQQIFQTVYHTIIKHN